MNLPPCSTWKLWTGYEVEGASDLSVLTLFVRGATMYEIGIQLEQTGAKRLWFCKEYLRGKALPDLLETLKALETNGFKICVELALADYGQYAEALRPYCTFYVKVPELSLLQEGDHVCIGQAFSDEAFRMGDGHKVTPADYLQDKFIS